MKIFEANITQRVSIFLNEYLKNVISFDLANQKLIDGFGIMNFFENNDELNVLKETTSEINSTVEENNRAEYGDFQTNAKLADQVSLKLLAKNINPKIIVEPTCGKGNFIIASLKNFKAIQFIYGVEVYKPYIWETKFGIVNFFLENPKNNKPAIFITHSDVFDFNFNKISKEHSKAEILIIGNPPWVTNSKLGSLNSSNLPRKTNFKKMRGLDAMTGKGNFDIAESITLKLIEAFQSMKGNLLLLVKNSVIKNIIFSQNKNQYRIAFFEKECIDSKKEFNVSVEASLFYCKLNSDPGLICKEFNFYDSTNSYLKFGWLNDKFVSNIDTYVFTKHIDGESHFVWRQGLKHDCSAIMELNKVNGHYVNGLNEEIKLEDGLVYGILKSSDLKNTVINQTRKFTIVTQKKVGQETRYIKSEYPKTYKYLIEHQENFNSRKSSIYLNKPLFSIFGIGDYSFKPYKVAISGLYKTFHFTLILPQNNKAVMLDDTCYLIGFEKIEYAVYTLILLNSETTVQFLQSVTFPDAKRTFTKDVLMRISLLALTKSVKQNDLKLELERLNTMYNFNLTLNLWESFMKEITPLKSEQIAMFG